MIGLLVFLASVAWIATDLKTPFLPVLFVFVLLVFPSVFLTHIFF